MNIVQNPFRFYFAKDRVGWLLGKEGCEVQFDAVVPPSLQLWEGYNIFNTKQQLTPIWASIRCSNVALHYAEGLNPRRQVYEYR